MNDWNDPKAFELPLDVKRALEQGIAKTHLTLWQCGDDECNCYKPQLEVRGPKTINGNYFPEFLLGVIWEGSFHSHPEPDDWLQMRKQFEDAAKKYKPDSIITFDWLYGDEE